MRLSGSALNNEFFTHAAQSWRERLADGECRVHLGWLGAGTRLTGFFCLSFVLYSGQEFSRAPRGIW